MRFFYFLMLVSFSLHAQIDVGNGAIANCTEADLSNGGNVQCGDLTVTLSPVFLNPIPAVDVRVTGNVYINDDIILSGGNSANNAGAGDDFKGLGGPGADDGGNSNFTNPLAANPPSGGGVGDTGVCAGGGAGGGFVFASVAGLSCGAASGGALGPAFSSIFSTTLRGGFGGGAGGFDGVSVGAGGGGGGAIRIRAGGNVIINANIIANGGNGGNSLSDGGGGGGGSGGLIWIQALGTISNTGTMLAAGGNGGTSNNTGFGSNGSRGAIRIETVSGTITNTGTLPPYAEVQSLPFSSAQSLNSSISCGLVNPRHDSTSSFLQLFVGFLAVIAFSYFSKKLKFFSKTQV